MAISRRLPVIEDYWASARGPGAEAAQCFSRFPTANAASRMLRD
jgi:hypothetical protein